ncbi:hypothetical protein FRC09_005390 [Ceratobasidium sp. 395]|nr:hypothetical protein FRC09_005390 [Ceratobasidium sp. 395]
MPSTILPSSHAAVHDGAHLVAQGDSETPSINLSHGTLGRSPLSTSLYGGALSRGPNAHIIGNAYSEKICWDEGEKNSLKALDIDADLRRMKRWAVRAIGNNTNVHATSHTNGKTIERLFKGLCSTPTLVYVNGHTDTINGELVYLPADCSDGSSVLPTSGIPFMTMREWLADAEDLMSLVIVTDICKCTNIFGLPFMAKKIEGVWKWTRTKECSSNDTLNRWTGTKMLHFASTSQGEDAQEFTRVGGIYTRGFSNVGPHDNVALGKRLDVIQDHMDTFFLQWTKIDGKPRLKQHHRVYSSFQPSFDDTNVFEIMGICQTH